MSSFKFCFAPEDNENLNNAEETTTKWIECEELHASSEQITEIENVVKHANIFVCGDLEIGYLIADDVIKTLESENNILNTLEAEKEYSDLVAGKYEGGLKIWECTSDLANYINSNINSEISKNRVLDLGCGAGILGIIALLKGATAVDFQDYNKEVIMNFTIPNVLLNLDEDKREAIKEKCHFFSGDWKSFQENTSNDKYDLILTSETIYNTENYAKLCSLFKVILKENGQILLAAKNHYFGVGGGIRQFESFVKANGLQTETVMQICTGIKREIIKITF